MDSLFTVTSDMQATASGAGPITHSQPRFGLNPGQRYNSIDIKGIDLVGLNVPPAKASVLATSPAEYNAVISASGVPA